MRTSQGNTPNYVRGTSNTTHPFNSFHLSLRNGIACATIITTTHGYGQLHFDQFGRFADSWVSGKGFCIAYGKIKLVGIDRRAKVRLTIIEDGRVRFRGRMTFNVRFDAPSTRSPIFS